MATPGATQALLASFFFGILFNAASAALVLFVMGHGSLIFRDGLRLVLITFLASSAAWALVGFLAAIIEPTTTSTCQVAVIFSSIFDQLGRVSIEQYLLWAVGANEKSISSMASQVLVLGRFGLGIAFIGLTRGDFNPTCVPVSSVSPVAVTVIVLDAIILTLAAIKILPRNSVRGDSASDLRAPIGTRSVTIITIGLTIWLGTSVTLLLGMKATELVFKTTLPTLGLAVLVALVTVLSGTMVIPRGPPPPRPDSPTTRDIGGGRDLVSSDSTAYPPSRYEDVKGANIAAMAAYVSRNDAAVPRVSMPAPQTSGTGGSENQRKMKKHTKRSLWAKAPAGRLVISKPVLVEQEGMGNPLDRIPTIDLITAASNEKERRIKLAQLEQTLIAQRPAPHPPNTLAQMGPPAREISLKRKEVGPPSLTELVRSASAKTKTSAALSIEANASSTSSELSPGADMIRRRSPRYPSASSVPIAFQPVRPGEPVRVPIPRPRDPVQSPKAPEPATTPLQRRPTTGLPSNPRAQAMKSMAKEAGNQRQQTVMFVNDILYDDPDAVGTIIQGASKTPVTSLDSADSVVNRPRPIPRKGDKDRQVFPAEVSPSQGHQRSKSGGSVASRKSVLRSMPGSPTQLPPLPPPPKSAGDPSRPLPNNTKSMTFDEKMDFLYTGPTSAPPTTATATATANKGQSPVPGVPPLPPIYLAGAGQPSAEGVPELANNKDVRISKTTDRSSIRTTSVLGIEDLPQRSARNVGGSYDTAGGLGQFWPPGPSTGNEKAPRPSHERMNRRSSPVIPVGSHFSMPSLKDEGRGRDEDASTVWGSVHSPVAAVDIQQARQNAHSTYIRKDLHNPQKWTEPNISINTSSVVGSTLNRSGGLDYHGPPEDDKAPSKISNVQLISSSGFHRRVGEECPTFSTRKGEGRLRKMPPPPPLILNGKSSQKAILVRAAEPSPLESPEAAYQMIQAQLQRFEQPNRDSVESQGRRLALLENLEREMGQLENQWQSSQYRLERDSLSSIQTDSRPASIAADRKASRRALMRIGVAQSRGEDDTATPSSQSSGTNSESMRPQYIKDMPDPIMERDNLGFPSVPKVGLGSPSPPDTRGSEYGNESPGSVELPDVEVSVPLVQIYGLWKPKPASPSLSNSGLWTGAAKRLQEGSGAHEFLDRPARPGIRKTQAPLTIESSRLWEKPTENDNSTEVAGGLWVKHVLPQDPKPNRVIPRLVIARPPRRNKRVSLLPDILENPEPLPDKRGTLGLFQFAWGERSENASIQPPPNPMYAALPGTMASGGPFASVSFDARSRPLEAEEFTTSFFDDYEAEEEGDNFDAFLGSDEEDFDENTLWEIANLLKAENVPSRNSLLLPPREASPLANSPVLSRDAAGTSVNRCNGDSTIVEELTLGADSYSPDSEPISGRSPLWAAKQVTPKIHATFGLPQPDSITWESYVGGYTAVPRFKSRAEDVAPIQSDRLWEPGTQAVECRATGLLWNGIKPTHDPSTAPSQTDKAVMSTKSYLWTLPVPPIASEPQGLFQARFSREYRRTSKEPAAILIERKPRTTETPLEKLVSKTLWTVNVEVRVPLLWQNPISADIPEHDGLFDNNVFRPDHRRTVREPAAISMRRAPRTSREPLAALETNSLWSRDIIVSQPARGLQLLTAKAPAVLVPFLVGGKTASKAETKFLWEKPEASPELEQEGLFDADAVRNDYRRTSKIPAAMFTPKKPRVSKDPLPSITTTSLWTRELLNQKPLAFTVEPRTVSEGTASSNLVHPLWKRFIPTPLILDHEGLFNVDIPRTDCRRTSKPPAAINAARKPRKVENALANLTSAKLWVMPFNPDYAVPTKSVSLWSEAASSTVTSGLFQLDPNRKTYRTTCAEPAALQIVRKCRFIDTPAAKIESTHLWANGHDTPIEPDWITVSSVPPRSPPITSAPKGSLSHRASTVYRADWDGVLREAIADSFPGSVAALRASYPRDWDAALQVAVQASHIPPKIIRRAGSPREWSVALHEAMAASYPEMKFLRAQALSTEWVAEPQEAISKSYPHQATHFDVTIRHPAFMGSMKTATENIHPTIDPKMLGLPKSHRGRTKAYPAETGQDAAREVPVSASRLWTKPIQVRAPIAGGLWVSGRRTAVVSSSELDIGVERGNPWKIKRNPRISTSVTRPDFAEQGMWKRGYGTGSNSQSQSRDWLEDSTKKRFTRIELRY